ncbi:hypothetical protein DL96DRAFT_1687532 [Flagelloscypha sp. PMI_526]|nr:hypothetical protein DL96DRAFT_1687532 [Flagelloscypha sp. PMI_526]
MLMAGPTPSAALSEILRVSPRIGTYVKELYLSNSALTDMETPNVISMLPSVKVLALAVPQFQVGPHWSKLEVRGALMYGIFPSITFLNVSGFHFFPFHEVILLCLNLETLITGNNNMVVERARSTLKVLRLGGEPSKAGDNGLVFQQEVIRLLGKNLTYLRFKFTSGVSLVRKPRKFCDGQFQAFQLVYPSITPCPGFVFASVPDLWLQLDDALNSLKYLTKVWLLGKLRIADSKAIEAWRQRQNSINKAKIMCEQINSDKQSN